MDKVSYPSTALALAGTLCTHHIVVASLCIVSIVVAQAASTDAPEKQLAEVFVEAAHIPALLAVFLLTELAAAEPIQVADEAYPFAYADPVPTVVADEVSSVQHFSQRFSVAPEPT